MTPDFLVLAEAGDAAAGAVAAALAGRYGAGRVVQLTAGHLVQGRWRHGVAPDGAVQTLLAPPGGAVIDSRQVRGVLDRVLALPPLPRFARSSPKDRDYAAAELQALLASWLAGFGPRLVNPAGPWTWLGGPRPLRAWMRDAAAHGLPVPRDAHATAGRLLPADASSRGFVTSPALPGLPASHDPLAGGGPTLGRVLVAGTFIGGSLAGTFGEACRRLGRSAGYRLAEFVFARIDGRPVLSDVDTVPALSDAAEVEAVVRLLAEIAAGAGGPP
ncbi:hypothetical protein LRS73_03325 [Methylobacterium currus]|uniref:hypothetical protein n=1 Tax=Methylobacterium currus TaxID=2051553 RepID=UPI0013DFC0C4|nr:hypothetical protein [Methylobacterium currus]UHC16965.1 hypothetical protein LRS73_03325 [Methylobacterium currus]